MLMKVLMVENKQDLQDLVDHVNRHRAELLLYINVNTNNHMIIKDEKGRATMNIIINAEI